MACFVTAALNGLLALMGVQQGMVDQWSEIGQVAQAGLASGATGNKRQSERELSLWPG
jgi:hypothetical protein